MKKEKCSHCQNIVIGVFTPSETRKWLTALAKKGGMKSVGERRLLNRLRMKLGISESRAAELENF